MEKVTKTTLRRLPQYLQYLKQCKDEHKQYASAAVMSQCLGVHHTQIRKDFDVVGVKGLPKVGHPVDQAIDAIEEFLGWKNTTSAFLVGAGNLGTALMGYAELSNSGIKIEAAFDNDKDLIGKTINGVEIFPTEKFVNLANRLHIHIAILTVPISAAEQVTEMILKTEIKAVWNFIPKALEFPPHIIVENADIFASLAILSKKLKNTILP